MQDQTSELEKLGISATYFGSAQIDPNSESKALCAESNTLVVFVSPEWLFSDKNNYLKIGALNDSNRLGLIAIDEAHLVYDWQDFRQLYKRCEELHSLFPNVPLMALSATVIPQIEDALRSFMHDPLVEEVRSTVVTYTWLLSYAILKGLKDQNNPFHWSLEILITLLMLSKI